MIESICPYGCLINTAGSHEWMCQLGGRSQWLSPWRVILPETDGTETKELSGMIHDQVWEPQDDDAIQPLQFGWECPRCGQVNAPQVLKCDCKPQTHSSTVYPESISNGVVLR